MIQRQETDITEVTKEKGTTEITKETNEKDDEITKVNEENTHKESEVMKGNNDDLQVINKVVTAEVHNADQREDSETTITASEGEGENSQLTPGQRTPVGNEKDTDDSMICEAAANVEVESEAFIGFSQVTQDKDKVNEKGKVNKKVIALPVALLLLEKE